MGSLSSAGRMAPGFPRPMPRWGGEEASPGEPRGSGRDDPPPRARSRRGCFEGRVSFAQKVRRQQSRAPNAEGMPFPGRKVAPGWPGHEVSPPAPAHHPGWGAGTVGARRVVELPVCAWLRIAVALAGSGSRGLRLCTQRPACFLQGWRDRKQSCPTCLLPQAPGRLVAGRLQLPECLCSSGTFSVEAGQLPGRCS